MHVPQFYPAFPFSRFPIHDGYVHPVAGGKVELWHDWVAGVDDAHDVGMAPFVVSTAFRSTDGQR